MKASQKGSKLKPKGSAVQLMVQLVSKLTDVTDDAVKCMVAKGLMEVLDSHVDLEEGSSTASTVSTADISGLEGTQWILAQMKEDRLFLAGEIERNALEIRMEIQAIGVWTATLEVKAEAAAKAQNSLLSQSHEWGT
ncbi:Hypothetical predicted protein [Pelobates cultripes]|uniref:Uncharacterized protein n=1 Tax=Pelobates cultripes TaxID=61616 RepID=A0AAD1S4G5_PELCU|nr:Hypothetical predicted protein [Pelobates cultripes]